MNLNFTFNHTSNLSMAKLHENGIRSTKELEEVFLDPDTVVIEITENDDAIPVFMAVGFSIAMIPILYIFSASELITSFFARKASKAEIKQYFCGK